MARRLAQGRTHVEKQMATSRRLLVGTSTVGRAQTARVDRPPQGADLEADMQNLLNTGREWLLALPPLRGV